MARVGFVMPAIDEAGNRISTGQAARVFDDMACTTATVITDDAAGGTTITQPITPTTGAFTPLTVTTGTGDTTLTVSSTTGFSVGQYIPIYDGTTTKWRFIRSILAGPPRLTIESAIGVVFSSTNTIVGHPAFVGIVAGFVPDTTFHYLQITEIASGLAGPGTLIPTFIGVSSVGVGEEGTTVGTRALVNFIGPRATAVDNGGAARVDVTIGTPTTTLGDIIYGGASGVETRLGVGAETASLQVVSGLPAWASDRDAQDRHTWRLEPWAALTGASQVFVGTGSIIVNTSSRGIQLSTGATNPSSASLRSRIEAASATSYNASKIRRIDLQCFLEVITLSNDNNYIYFTDEDVDKAPSATARHIGIKCLSGVSSFTTADGTTEQTTAITTWISTAAPNRFVVTFDGTTAKCYIDGVLRATHATNVPTAASAILVFHAFTNNAAAAADRRIQLYNAEVVMASA